ncbi:hypothetical protein ABXV24_04100 [Vibrio owensii]|uniref:hypothetical protein n=1 Tax=Vibrio owensii TaxID=696485 RepID=UPI003397375A
MKIKLRYLMFISLLISFGSNAITVDKMLIIANKEEKLSEIVVNNPSEFPVFLKLTLSERKETGEVEPLDINEFEKWPVFVERSNYIVEGEGEVTIPIQYLTRKLGEKQLKDRIIAIDIMPESTLNNGESGQKMSVLIGYRVWLIISKDGEVKGLPEFELKDGVVSIKNKTNTVFIFDMDICDTNYDDELIETCKSNDFILSGNEKEVDVSGLSGGIIKFEAYDPYKRIIELINIELR